MDYITKVHAVNSQTDSPPLCMIQIYGCQQNLADGDRLRGLAVAMGYGLTNNRSQADLLLINTCAVRDHAEQRVLGHLGGFLHKGKPGQKIILCGCMAARPEVRETLRRSYRQVSLTFPPSDIPRFPEYLYKLLTEGERQYHDSDTTAPIDEAVPAFRDPPPRAHVTIMTGCDNFCSYCIVPYVRGRERSRPPEAVLTEIEGLIRDGYSEIWLLGQNVNSYAPGFPELLRAAGAFPGEYTLRFMTSHPRDANDDLFRAMAETPNVAPFLHLPVQAGSNRILSAMNRGYTREQFLEKTAAAQKYIPRLNLTSDIIVGFPSETEADFEDTLDLVRSVRFNSLFTFIYSPREGTPAAKLPQTNPPEVIKERFERLLKTQKEIETTL